MTSVKKDILGKRPPANANTPPRKPVAVWLFACAGAVFLMALIGAVTRLTESGLSIVQWHPITGALPPLNQADWQHEFDLYKLSPQYIKVNEGMSLGDFKHIFFWEGFHRLWGRTIGLIYALPMAWFWFKGRLPQDKKKLFLAVLGLGFFQGLLGWFMVASGLVNQPAVSHYRLAAHLMTAFLIYACLFRLGLIFTFDPQKEASDYAPVRNLIRLCIAAVAVTMTWGAFVAGLRAGWLYNTFPTMDGYWLPPELFKYTPMWKAFFAEPATVQFTHRVLAISTFALLIFTSLKGQALGGAQNLSRRAGKLFVAVTAMALVQVSLGISTLLSHVEIYLATLHQAGALTLLTLLVWLLHEIPQKES
ncbi:MAG: heme A synthase [Alphaproteobacteria bacterium]|nr:heme A synthase [Alphaproteobacteria bacterium]